MPKATGKQYSLVLFVFRDRSEEVGILRLILVILDGTLRAVRDHDAAKMLRDPRDRLDRVGTSRPWRIKK